MSAIARVAHFAAVDLSTLTAEADLQTRVDRKYVLPASALPAVLADLDVGTRVLEVGGERALRYASRYYDTPELDSYLGAARGRRRRFKVRARSYLDSGGSFLEVKTRGGRSATVKDRVPVAGGRLDASGVAYAAELLDGAGIADAVGIADRLAPVLDTGYRRITLLLDDGADDASRATIDIALTWHDLAGAAFALPSTVIVETKSARRTGAVDRALWRHGHRPSTVSKYGTGLAALRPALPRNKWNRVLTRHFADAALRPAARAV